MTHFQILAGTILAVPVILFLAVMFGALHGDRDAARRDLRTPAMRRAQHAADVARVRRADAPEQDTPGQDFFRGHGIDAGHRAGR